MTRPRHRLEQLAGEIRTVAAGSNVSDRVYIASTLLHAHLHLGRARRIFGWLPEPDQAARTVRLSNGQSLLVRPQDAIVLFEQFGLSVYDIPGLFDKTPTTIVDLGANVGFATLALARRYPAARFVCVEPVTETRELLRSNLSLNGVTALVMSVGIVDRSMRLTVKRDHFSAIDRLAQDAGGEIEGVSIGEVLDRAEFDVVDLLKIDIEGAERDVFAGAANWAPRVRAIVAELHDGLTPVAADALLAPHGYEQIALGNSLKFTDLAAWRQRDTT